METQNRQSSNDREWRDCIWDKELLLTFKVKTGETKKLENTTQHTSRCCLQRAQSRSSAAFRLFQVIFRSFDVMIMKWAGNVNSDDAVRLFDASACTYTNADTRPRPGSWKYLQWKCGCAGKNNETKSEPLFPGRSPVFDHTKANRIYPEEQSNLKIDWLHVLVAFSISA